MQRLQNDVQEILFNDASCRDNDNKLYSKVLKLYAKRNGYELERIDYFLNRNFAKEGIPSFESVSRSRRRLQNLFPELKGSTEAIKARKAQEAKYKAFFRDKHNG